MAAGASTTIATNGTHVATAAPVELAITLPHDPSTRIYLHLTVQQTSIVLFLTSASLESGQLAAPMGSFVYAMPDRYNPAEPISTPLYNVPSTIDFSTRMAKLLVRRTKKACYVGSSVSLSGSAGGGTVEEEMEAFRAIVTSVTAVVQKHDTN